jgi:hypothetical protein
LSDVYRTPGGTAPSDSSLAAAAAPTTATPPIVRGQEPMQPVMPLPDRAAAPPASLVAIDPNGAAAGAAPPNLNRVEQAAFDEIMSRATDAEVVCIIRPREPGGKSEVITLESVSPEFVRALAERSRAAQGATLR